MTESTAQASPAYDGLPDGARGRAMLVIILGLTLSVLDSSIVNLALPAIARELQASSALTLWVVNAYQLAGLVLLLPLAALGERLGYRRIYLLGMTVFVIASVAATLASSLSTLIAARVFQGMGAAGIMSVNAALVRLTYPRAMLGRGMAINSLVVATSSMAGPSVAAAILSVASWPWLFAINVPLGLMTLWMGRKALPANPVVRKNGEPIAALDVLLNILMFTLLFLGGEQLGVRMGQDQGAAGSPLMPSGWWLLGAGLVVGYVYLRRQWHKTAPLFPVDLMRIPVFRLSMCGSVSAFCAQMLSYLALPFLLLEARGLSPMEAGMLITAWPLATVLTAPVAGRLIGKYPDGLLGGIGMAMFACGLWLLAAMPVDVAHWDMVWRMLLAGSGFALYQSPNNHTIVTSAPMSRSGAAGGMLSSARMTGQTLGAVVLATIFAISGGHGGNAELLALAVAGGFAALAGVFSILRVRPGKQQH
ncbi:UNVERIFIED_CONTAM: MFS transporter [Comamonas sp. A-3]|uniref:MFS transporter n=1 Tax=Comamonas thiooxydans TaxID=363952 RepID=A0A0E3BUN8_9BURK|nr:MULTISPECIES: MFS transporter [Comamonas]KGH12270.1 MFS transporter [Comamonas thiooxydans]KGH19181.1 MFS transporter [Comamonas thiooxydans]KGH23156.1 MFS transporter [Comamonas thiooxydans]MBL5979326.1 MFS transporter [Comamonas sp. NyZ500]MDH1253118.1 MFS transporter [Comamonas thiooxydans]